MRAGGSKPDHTKSIVRIINKQVHQSLQGAGFHSSLPVTELQSRNTYTVDDVDVAIECRQIGSDYVGIPNAEALENNAQFHLRLQRKLVLLSARACARVHTYPLALANFPKCGGICVHGW